MKALFLPLGLAIVLTTGCVRPCCDAIRYQNSGRQKPIVAVLPVLNCVEEERLKWDLSKELTDEIRKKVYDSPHLYLWREQGDVEKARELSTQNPYTIAQAAVTGFGATEYIVVTEVITQDDGHYTTQGTILDQTFQDEAGGVLALALRVRVIDIRNPTPRVILQEVLDQNFAIPRTYMTSDNESGKARQESYMKTPMGMAHARMVREVVSRVEAYIEASR